MPKRTFEVWVDSQLNCVSISDAAGIAERFRQGLFSSRARLLRHIDAFTWEQALFAHHRKMKWGAFVPPQPRRRCPNDCGSYYYPNGSGECPKCGRVC